MKLHDAVREFKVPYKYKDPEGVTWTVIKAIGIYEFVLENDKKERKTVYRRAIKNWEKLQ